MLVISAGKRLGLSFDEMNELTTQDLIDLLHSTVSAAKKDAEPTPDEQQTQFDRYFGAGGLV